ncbi:O-acyltransferase like protein-like [Vanessa cardui]|uniref:O-acyltransferase like protein-like n=1 Tax=Vanessa cardui TaxID=171605 RepID=UPI001F138A6E|nr:O-acyltransferase like protein-like [Vanessa cardui]
MQAYRRARRPVSAMTPARALFFALLCACVLYTLADSQTSGFPLDQIPAESYHYATNGSNGTKYSDYAADVFVTNIQNVGNPSPGDDQDIIYHLSDEEYYEMPILFHLDEYPGCLAMGGAYCLGSFELSPSGPSSLFRMMQRYSANWVDNFNHTRLHRGLCLTRSCAAAGRDSAHALDAWFASCVNASVTSAYNLSARLYHLDYCTRGPDHRSPPLSTSERAFAGLVVALLALATVSTALDMKLSDHTKKEYGWALCWSLRRSWRSLTAPAPGARGPDLRCFDGLRVLSMLCVIIEHVCWLGTLSYVADTRYFEQARRATDVVLMTNSTLMVQVFFLMASFLLAHKLLQERQREPAARTFFTTMFNRIIRISPSYFVVLWFASSWWERLGSGPQWSSLVRSEAATCRHKWWTHLLYMNNVLYPDEKCLIQTWYLAADMQLYAVALLLTLLLRGRRLALPLLGTAFAMVTVVPLMLAYAWHLVPTFVVHRPESVRRAYSGDASFTWLYQSPLSNAAGALAGLLLAHAHHARLPDRLAQNNIFRWVSVYSAPAAMCWVALSPLLLGAGPPNRLAAAVLAALERPIFVTLVAVALLGAINGIDSPWRRWMSRGGAVLARLSFGALLLHMLFNKTLLATRLAPAQLDRQSAIMDWFGVAVISYAAALPLALLVELPAQQLHKEIKKLNEKSTNSKSTDKPKSLDKTDICSTQQCNSNS